MAYLIKLTKARAGLGKAGEVVPVSTELRKTRWVERGICTDPSDKEVAAYNKAAKESK